MQVFNQYAPWNMSRYPSVHVRLISRETGCIAIVIYELNNMMWTFMAIQFIQAYLLPISIHNIDTGLITFPFISVCMTTAVLNLKWPLLEVLLMWLP